MAKTTKPMTPGVHWHAGGSGWIPRFVWRGLEVEGSERPAKVLLPQEAMIVLMEFLDAAGKAIFGVAPYLSVEHEGRTVYEPNPEFDKIPTMKDLLGGLKDPANIEVRSKKPAQEPEQIDPAPTTPEGIPLDQIDPSTLPADERPS